MPNDTICSFSTTNSDFISPVRRKLGSERKGYRPRSWQWLASAAACNASPTPETVRMVSQRSRAFDILVIPRIVLDNSAEVKWSWRKQPNTNRLRTQLEREIACTPGLVPEKSYAIWRYLYACSE